MNAQTATPREPSVTGRLLSVLPVVPIAVAVFVILLANLLVIVFRMRLRYPADGWEAGIVTDAWRMLQGQAIYATGTDHATHMYGPLVTVFLAQAFRFTGPELYVGRLVSAVSGIALVAMLAKVFGRGDRMACRVAAALLLTANTRTFDYFTQTRPDLDSFLFATLALLVLYRALEPAREKPGLALAMAGSALMIIAVLFKQTAVVFMFVPLLSVAVQFSASSVRKRLLAASLPIAGVLVTFAVIRQFAPAMWHFMVAVPARYHIDAAMTPRYLVELLASLPLFLLALINWLFTDAQDNWLSPTARWLMATLICTIPSSVLAAAKDGANLNSLIPALLSVGAFCAWRAPVALEFLRDAARPTPLRIVTGILLACVLFDHVYPGFHTTLSPALLKAGLGSDDRALVIEEARSLPGRVVSPDDPTIALEAKGYAGRTARFEGDNGYSKSSMQRVLMKEIAGADYVIVIPSEGSFDEMFNDAGPYLNSSGVKDKEHLLAANGFARSAFRSTSTGVYELWRRAQPSGPPGPS